MRAVGRRASSLATQPARPPTAGPQESAAPIPRGIVDKQTGPDDMAAAVVVVVVVVVVVAGLKVPHLTRRVVERSAPAEHATTTR